MKIIPHNLFIILTGLILLTACATPTLSPTYIPTLIEPSAKPLVPTETIEPTLTVQPPDLIDEATWPADMRTYYDRRPSEWNNPTLSYMSNAEFNSRLMQMRRDFLEKQGVASVETMSENELFTAYVRWGFENKQQLILSPQERINIIIGPWAPYYVDTESHDGILARNHFTQMPDQAFLDALTTDLAHMTSHVYGQEIQYTRPAYDGVIATLVGVVKPVGSRAESSTDCLLYYERDNIGYWAIVNVSFTPEHHASGEEFVSLSNGYRIFTYEANYDSTPVLLGLNAAPELNQQTFLGHLGSRIWLKAGGNTVASNNGDKRVSEELTAAGVEKAQAVIFDIQQPPTPILPWQ